MTCYDRNDESKRLWAHFAKEHNVLMLAPRRIGKTVLLNRLKEESEKMGYRAIVLDVEGFREEKDFFRQMCAAIQEELGFGGKVITSFTEKLHTLFSGSEAAGGDWRQLLLQNDWREFAGHLLSHLNNDKEGKPWLVLVDEIPIFVLALLESHGIERVHDFLYTLRNLRGSNKNVRWLYTGSIGLDTIARRNGVEGALTGMEVFPLHPFTRETASGFLTHIAEENRRNMEPKAAERIIARLGWLSPYYLEKIAEEACQLTKPGQSIDIAVADKAVESMLDLSKRTYWATWREHLDKNFIDPEQTRLFTILATVAKSPDGKVSLDKLLAELNRGEPVGEFQLRDYLDTLEADGYLSGNTENGYSFRMELLREWWRRYVTREG